MFNITEALKKSRHTIVLTGAGMSTESGLKDFRSNGGLWAGKDPMEIASTETIRPIRPKEDKMSYIRRIKDFNEFYKWRMREVLQSTPHEGHRILAKWQANGYVKRILTQNVDGYHQTAGSKDVVALHGNLMQARCEMCQKQYSYKEFLELNSPFCDCEYDGVIRPNIVLFGEMLGDSYEIAMREATKADLVIAMGTSLQVSPANMIPQEVLSRGGRFVIINLEPTEMDKYADRVVNNFKIGDVLRGIDAELPYGTIKGS